MARDESQLIPTEDAAPPSARREHVDLSTATPDQIRADIERTRSEMDRTLERLTTRVQPRHLLDDVLDFFQRGDEGADEGRAHRTVREAGTLAADKLKSNPVPATLIGAGLAWLLFQDKSPRRSQPATTGYDPYTAPREPASSGDEGVLEKAKDALHDMKEAASDKLDSARASAHRAVEGARTGTRRGEQAGKGWMEESPLAVGVAALAAGLMAGLVLPGTRVEDELMGEASDELKQQARATGEELASRGSEAVSAATETLKDDARDEGLSPEEIGPKLERMADRAFDSMRNELEH